MHECIDVAGEKEGNCLTRGSVWVPICDSIVVARLQLHILDTLSFSLMELLFSLIVVLACHVSEECILWNSDPSCKYRTKPIQVPSWKMLVPVNLGMVLQPNTAAAV